MSYLLKIKKHKYLINLRGKIIVSPSRGHDMIILFIEIDGWKENHIRILSRNFYCN